MKPSFTRAQKAKIETPIAMIVNPMAPKNDVPSTKRMVVANRPPLNWYPILNS